MLCLSSPKGNPTIAYQLHYSNHQRVLLHTIHVQFIACRELFDTVETKWTLVCYSIHWLNFRWKLNVFFLPWKKENRHSWQFNFVWFELLGRTLFLFSKLYLNIFLLYSYSIIFCFCTTALGCLRYLILTSSLSQNHLQSDNPIFDLWKKIIKMY